jgi:hypothetical protein
MSCLSYNLPVAKHLSHTNTIEHVQNHHHHKVNLWATQHNSRTNWHYDMWHNCLCLVRGRKELLLCAPLHGNCLLFSYYLFSLRIPFLPSPFLCFLSPPLCSRPLRVRMPVVNESILLGHRLLPHPVFAVMPNHCRLTLPIPTTEDAAGEAVEGVCGCLPQPWAPCPSGVRDVPMWRVTLEVMLHVCSLFAPTILRIQHTHSLKRITYTLS